MTPPRGNAPQLSNSGRLMNESRGYCGTKRAFTSSVVTSTKILIIKSLKLAQSLYDRRNMSDILRCRGSAVVPPPAARRRFLLPLPPSYTAVRTTRLIRKPRASPRTAPSKVLVWKVWVAFFPTQCPDIFGLRFLAPSRGHTAKLTCQGDEQDGASSQTGYRVRQKKWCSAFSHI